MMGLASRQKGVRRERAVAQVMGGQRLPSSGRRGMPDVVNNEFAAEVKSRATWPAWLVEAVEQALRGATLSGKRPVVVLELCRPNRPPVRLWAHVGDDEWRHDHA